MPRINSSRSLQRTNPTDRSHRHLRPADQKAAFGGALNTLRFPAPTLSNLWFDLIGQSPDETAAFLLAGHSNRGEGIVLLAREFVPVPSDAYLVRHAVGL